MREFKHPDFDHVFMIKDISPFEIEIDGIRVKRSNMFVVNRKGGSWDEFLH
jgi:hypothetical protein